MIEDLDESKVKAQVAFLNAWVEHWEKVGMPGAVRMAKGIIAALESSPEARPESM